ncbi:MAG TPA: glycosyl hydrolase [Solirubrobacteraceae bacterium]|nr:glycosyl hydrolase [Solirubrobacteraceae bacterium]
MTMRLFPRTVLAALLVLLGAVLLAAAPAGAAQQKPKPRPLVPVVGALTAKVGIADQKPDMFADKRFSALGLKNARRSVAWDTMQYDWQIEDVDRWLQAARDDGVTPVLTFARSRIGTRRHMKPTAAQITTAFKAFRQRWPWVTNYVASNESNHFGEPTGRSPRLAAQWYRAMRQVCPVRCKIAGATLLDYPNLVSWAREFLKHAKVQPKYWALHNYISANRFDPARTRQFLQATTGEVWLTEVGGAVKMPTAQAKLPTGTKHAAQVTRYILDDLARISKRITRIYLYHWNAAPGATTWDSGLIGADGKARPAFTVFKTWLKGTRTGAKAGKLVKTPGAKGKAKPEGKTQPQDTSKSNAKAKSKPAKGR